MEDVTEAEAETEGIVAGSKVTDAEEEEDGEIVMDAVAAEDSLGEAVCETLADCVILAEPV